MVVMDGELRQDLPLAMVARIIARMSSGMQSSSPSEPDTSDLRDDRRDGDGRDLERRGRDRDFSRTGTTSGRLPPVQGPPVIRMPVSG